jgi:succinoglycan biosynthesis transport protein ExoP
MSAAISSVRTAHAPAHAVPGPAPARTPFADWTAPSEHIDLRGALNLVKRRRSLIVSTAAVLTVAGSAFILVLTPRYSAEATIIIDGRKTQVIDLQAVVSGLPTNEASTIRNEIEVLQSTKLAQKVASKLNLSTYAEFNPVLRPEPMLSRAKLVALIPNSWWQYLPSRFTAHPIEDDQAPGSETDVVQELLDHVKVSNDGRSHAIKLRAESENPKLAAAIANTYAQTYLLEQLEAKYEATDRATKWLDERSSELREKVRERERAVQTYRAINQLEGFKGVTMTGQQLSELNTQLVIASADRAQKESVLREVQGMLRSSAGAAAAAPVLNSALIQKLAEQESDLRRKEVELGHKYGPAHPAMIEIRAQLGDIRKKIQEEVSKIVRSVEADVNAARSRETTLRNNLQQLGKTNATQASAAVQLKELEREAESTRLLYENFLARFKETAAQQDIQEPDGRIIAEASIPKLPSFPRAPLMILITALGSVVIGVLIAMAREELDSALRSADDVERATGLSVLGLIPDLGRGEQLHTLVLSQPTSPAAETVRGVRTALRFAVGARSEAGRTGGQVIVVTSSVPEEGKTQFALALARSAAKAGSRVLLIDCDARRPSASQALALPRRQGLVALLSKTASVEEAVARDEESGMDVIRIERTNINPQDVFESDFMQSFLATVRREYDLVVLDTPPVMAVSDAVGLANLADSTLFLVRWEKTPRRVAMNALKQLRDSGAPIAGAVLSRVNLRRHALYGFDDYGFYVKRYGDYYNPERAERAA